MNTRKIVAALFMLLAVVLGAVFYSKLDFPQGLETYFEWDYYNQFGPLAICVELLIAGFYLYRKHPKTNFAMALFGFTALLDPLFDAIGLFTSNVPTYGMILFAICALPALWLAFSNTFKLGRISFLGALASFVLGNAVELFFNYF